ncbi:MAG: DNA polymerase III subunit gamma/tau [Gammaproteobacteria bacterium]|nr:DNA polymerase III subunit gamma/tau [Gammaproteobacteria bacterium]
MSYQVLARKWRPRNFDEMVGQDHVRRALVNALDNDRLHHAFLFTGTRGVGKTTIARILAKSLNCEQGVSSKPCGVCSACREIDEGRFVDLIEVDAASRTKVEDTRDLLENVQYAPTRGRYKVYLIDEVHMLSTHSFNALLKTLEEPPPHVKFLLATTDPQKLPVTILSRCLQFNLKRVPVDLISKQLEYILVQEGIEGEPGARLALARAADGSLRDALSLLDQAIAYGGGVLRETEVRAMLGTIEQTHIVALLDALAGHDAPALLQRIQLLAEHSPDFAGVLADLLSHLHRIALAQIAPEAIDDSLGDRASLLRLAQTLSPEDVQLFYQIGLLGRRDLSLAPDARNGFEMALLRMLTFRPRSAAEPLSVSSATASHASRLTPHLPPLTSPADPAATLKAAPATTTPHPSPLTPHLSAPPSAREPVSDDWDKVLSALNLTGMLKQLAVNCALIGRTGDTLSLLLDSSQANLRTARLEERLQQALQTYYQTPVKLVLTVGEPGGSTPAQARAREQNERQQAAAQVIQSDANVQALIETFNARIHPDSIQPLD